MNGPVTAKLIIPSVVLVLGTDSVPVPAERRCRLPAMADRVRTDPGKSWKVLEIYCSEFQALESHGKRHRSWKIQESPGIVNQRFWNC